MQAHDEWMETFWVEVQNNQDKVLVLDRNLRLLGGNQCIEVRRPTFTCAAHAPLPQETPQVHPCLQPHSTRRICSPVPNLDRFWGDFVGNISAVLALSVRVNAGGQKSRAPSVRKIRTKEARDTRTSFLRNKVPIKKTSVL